MYRELLPYGVGKREELETIGTRCPRCGDILEINAMVEGDYYFCQGCGFYNEG